MAKKDLSMTDASARAGSELETLIRRASSEAEGKKIKTESFEEALKQERVARSEQKRSAVRVLFISQDTSLLNSSTQSLDGYLDLKHLFEEVHILILREGIKPKNPALRVEENVWIYTAAAKHWFGLPGAGVRLAESELVFANGFRPDLIVARDPFESGLVGRKLSQKYDRPLQVHIFKNYTTEAFKRAAGKNTWRRFLPGFTIKAATSVRSETAEIMDMLKKRFTIPDLALLPKFKAYESFISQETDVDLKAKYPQYVFFFAYVGKLGHDSSVFKVIDALRFLLRNPRVGLLIIGDGPLRKECEKRAQLLGIEKQIIFEKGTVDTVSYLKNCDVLLVTDTDAAGDEVALTGAAAGTALVAATNEVREDYFEDGISAKLVDGTDTQAIATAASELLNSMGERSQFATNAQEMVRNRFHRSAVQYREAVRNSIEQTLFVTEDET